MLLVKKEGVVACAHQFDKTEGNGACAYKMEGVLQDVVLVFF